MTRLMTIELVCDDHSDPRDGEHMEIPLDWGDVIVLPAAFPEECVRAFTAFTADWVTGEPKQTWHREFWVYNGTRDNGVRRYRRQP